MRTSFSLRSVLIPLLFVAFLAVALVISGCGNSSDQMGATPSPTAGPAPHTSASGPAISTKVSFDQLTLEAQPKEKQDKNGLVFLRFQYADNDGKVYECVMPKAMSEGQYTLAEWSSTFNAYRLPTVVAVKKGKSRENIGDFPFISPKPQAPPTTAAQPNTPQQPAGNVPMLPAPTLPSRMAPSPGMPAMPPMPPR